jgi:hypothetical protein
MDVVGAFCGEGGFRNTKVKVVFVIDLNVEAKFTLKTPGACVHDPVVGSKVELVVMDNVLSRVALPTNPSSENDLRVVSLWLKSTGMSKKVANVTVIVFVAPDEGVD